MANGINNISFYSNRAYPNIPMNSPFAQMQPTFTNAPDMVELSTKKKSSTTKTAVIAGASILGAIGITLGLRKYSQLNTLRKEFSKVFNKDLSLKETNTLANKYKEITKIKDTVQYEQRLRQELVNDFGYEDLPLEFVGNHYKFETTVSIPQNKYVIRTANVSREHMFKAYAHELRHVKQDEIAYRSGREAFLEAKRSRNIQCLKRDNPNADDTAIANFIENRIQPFYDNIWGKYPKIANGTKEYELAQKLNKAQARYIEQTEAGLSAKSKNLYRQNFIEDDAITVEEIMESIYKRFVNNA